MKPAFTAGRFLFSILFVSLVSAGAPLFSENPVPDDDPLFLRQEREYLDSLVEKFLVESADYGKIRSHVNEKISYYQTLPASSEKDYLLGRYWFFLATIEEGEQNGKRAEELFGKSLAHARKSAEKEAYSDSFRLIADCYTRLMNYNGFGYQISHGLKIKKNAKKALALDEENYKAGMSLALFLYNAPVFAGGDKEEAVRVLESIASSDTADSLDRYTALIWLAITLHETGHEEEAAQYLDDARSLYPANARIDALLKSYGLR